MFKERAIANLIFSLAPIVIGFSIAFLLGGALKNPGGYAWAALACYGIGFLLFAAAKVRNIRKGYFVSFGSSLMLPRDRWAYRIGYALMFCGLVITITLLIASKVNACV